MSLDLGAVVGRVVLEDVQFQRTYVRVVRQMGQLGAEAGKAGAGTDVLDRGLARVGASGTAAATGLGRASKATTENAAANQKDAAAAARLAAATTRVSEAMSASSGASARRQVLTLRQVAADERLVASSAAVGSSEARQAAQTAKLAAAQATAIGAGERLAASQTKWATKATAAGTTMTKKLTLPAVAAAGIAIDQAVKFQKATNVYVTAAGESEKNLSVVRAGIKATATETGESISQLTAAQYILEKANIRGAASQTLLNAATKGSIEENANLADVVQGATSIMASYHIGTEKSVQVINALKTAAGQSKSTMEEYIKSLSTVIPIASAAGIAVSQVLGAVSTLTQHGTTPAEATQELANTIRNLQAPSNVAVAALNQIGISSVNVSKNLGKRGLTGTIEYIESKLPKAGLVYLSTMKQMEAGTADLAAMQSKMPPSLAKLSKGFLDGTVTAKEYRTAFKNLGADGYAQGSQFLTLAAKVRGYNDSLKNGTPAQKTMAAELKAIFGGATGLNTVLQLGGHNLDGFKARTDAVGKSLHDGSKDVEGWSSTAKLASTQADIAKAKLHVLAIDAGTYLLPMFNKLVGGLSSAVTWFGHLSHTDKMVIGWSIGILAALGPVLAIGGRLATLGGGISRFSATAGRGIAGLAGASEETATRVGVAMSRISRSVMGLAAGGIASQIGGNSGGGWLASILLGSAGGWALGGPVGAAVGGISAAIFKGIGLWHDHSKAAQLAAQAETGFVASLTSAINADNGAIGTNLKLTLTKTLQDQGVLDKAQKLGIKVADVVAAAMGDSKAKAAVAAKMSSLTSGAQAMLDRILKPLGLANERKTRNALLSGHEDLSEPLFNAQGNKVALSKSQLADAQSAINAARGTDALAAALKKANVDVEKATAKSDQYAHALNDGRVNTGRFTAQLESLRAGTSVAMDSNGQLTNSLARGTVVGQHNIATLLSLAQAANADAVSTFNAARKHESLGNATRTANGVLATHVSQLMKTAAAAGFNSSSVADLISRYLHLPKRVATLLAKSGTKPADIQAILDKYHLVPRTVSTNVHAFDNASATIARVRGELSNLNGSTANVYVVTSTTGSGNRVSTKLKASGGYISGPGSGTSDSIPARLSNGEYVINAAQTAKYRSLLNDINSGTRGFAAGGPVSASSLTASALDTRLITAVHQLQGALTVSLRTVAASMRAVASRASSTVSAAIATATAPPVTDSATLAKSLGRSIATATGKEQQAEIAAANYTKLAAAAAKLSTEEKAATGSAKAHALALSNAAHAAHEAAANMKAGAAKTEAEKRARALDDEARAARQNASAVTTASKSRIAALKAEAATAATVAARAKEAASAARQAAKDAADAAAEIAKNLVASLQSSADALQTSITDFESTIKSGIAGDTSLSSLWQQLSGTDANGNPLTPSLTGLQGNLDAILTQAQNFSDDLNALLGDGASQDLITQLSGMGAEAGDALAKQLLAAGPAAVAALQTTMASIQTIAGNEADRLANSFFGPGVNAMQQFILGMGKQFPALKKALDPIIAEIQAALTAESKTTATSATAKPPGFSSGVTDFSGGLAFVHRGEALVNFTRPGSSVIPTNRVKDAFGGATVATLHPDDRALLRSVATAMQERPVKLVTTRNGEREIGAIANDHRRERQLHGDPAYR